MPNTQNMDLSPRDADAGQLNAWHRHIAIPAVVAAIGAKKGKADTAPAKPVIHSVLR